VARLKADRRSHGPGDTALKESPNAKYVFTDPRYFISAYLHEVHDLESREYPSAFEEIRDIIELVRMRMSGERTTTEEEKERFLGHYLESVTLANLTLGVYAMSVSDEHPDKSPRTDKYVRVLTLDAEAEVDAVLHLKEGAAILFEVSTRRKDDHVEKCNKAAEATGASYCLYGALDIQDVTIQGKTLITPLPYALLLF